MTIEELNKIIKEELDAYLGEEEGDDEIKVTTDEPEDKGDEALDTLKQIFNMLKPIVDDEEEAEGEEAEGQEDEEEDLAENTNLNEDAITASELAMLGGVMAANLGAAFMAAGGKEGLKKAIQDTGSTAKGIARFLGQTGAGKGIKGGGRGMEENMDHPNYRADYVKDVAHNAEKIKGGLNESVDNTARFKKLANIKD